MERLGDILVVDDEQPIVELIAEVLTDEGYIVRTALTAADARAAIVERRPDLVLVDLHMPGQVGTVFAHDLNSNGLAGTPIVLMTADSRAAHDLEMEGIDFCLLKPFDIDDLVDCVAKHMRQKRSV